MPAPFFVFRDVGAVNRGVGMPGGIWGFRDAGRCSGFRGRVCRSGDAGECLAGKGGGAFGGLPGARKTAGHSEDCRVLGRLLGTRRIAGRSEGGRGACGSLCVFRARLVNAWAGSCRELPEGPDCWLRIAGGAGAGCRELGRWEEGHLRVGGGVGCLEAICLAGTSLDAGKGLRVRRVAGCSGVGLKPGGGVPAFVGSRNRESRAYEGRRRGGNIRGAGISYEIPAPGWCLLT